jgi:nucleoside phosphorylase
MRILIVHDRAEVGDQIKTVCHEVIGQAGSIELANDYLSAVNCLRGSLFDLAIIDLTLPHVTGRGIATYETAGNLLREIIESAHIQSPGDIVGITQDEFALKILGKDIGQHLMAVISEDADGEWKRSLADRIRYCMKSAAARQASYRSQYDYSVCVVTALDKELAPFRSIFELSPDHRMPNAQSFVFQDRAGTLQRGVAYAIGRAGVARAAVKVQELLDSYRPQLLVMAGFCGGVEGKLKLGDIALFETVFDWDYGKWKSVDEKSDEFFARPEPISIRDHHIHYLLRSFVESGLPNLASELAIAKRLSPDFDGSASLKLVSAASGSAVVADGSVIRRIQELNESIGAVDMESYGLYLAATASYLKRPQVVCIKSVADMCDGTKHDGLHEACCYLSASAVRHLITKVFAFAVP